MCKTKVADVVDDGGKHEPPWGGEGKVGRGKKAGSSAQVRKGLTFEAEVREVPTSSLLLGWLPGLRLERSQQVCVQAT